MLLRVQRVWLGAAWRRLLRLGARPYIQHETSVHNCADMQTQHVKWPWHVCVCFCARSRQRALARARARGERANSTSA